MKLGRFNLTAAFAVLGLVAACAQESTFSGRSSTTSGAASALDGTIGNIGSDRDGDGIPDVVGDYDGDGVADSAGGSAKVDGLAAVKHCDYAKDRGYLKTAEETISYEGNFRTPGQCKWETMKNGHIRGYKEWPKMFSVASNRVICAMEFDSNKELQFDDSLILSINDNILFWGNVKEEVFEQKDGIYQYDWNKLKDSSMSTVGGGCVEGHINCEIPSHDVPGAIKLSFNDKINQTLMQDVEDKGATFVLRAFGDNDDGVDCSHTGVDLKVTYTYFER